MSLKKIALLAAPAALAFGMGAQASVTIDTFDDSQVLSVGAPSDAVQPTGTDTDTAASPSAISANRKFDVTVDTNPNGQALSAESNGGGSSQLTMSGGAGVFGQVSIHWENFAADFTDGGVDDTLTIGIISNNIPNDLIIELMDGSNNTAQVTKGLVFQPNPADFDFAFADFAGVDMTDITGVWLTLDLQFDTGTDTRIDFIQTNDKIPPPSVPVPATLALFGLGLIGLRRFAKSRV